MNLTQQELSSKLSLETGRLSWRELERHFARGIVIRVSGELDLVEVATCIALDNKTAVEAWLSGGSVAKANSEDARQWHERQAEFWAVVTAPWILVQEIRPEE